MSDLQNNVDDMRATLQAERDALVTAARAVLDEHTQASSSLLALEELLYQYDQDACDYCHQPMTFYPDGWECRNPACVGEDGQG